MRRHGLFQVVQDAAGALLFCALVVVVVFTVMTPASHDTRHQVGRPAVPGSHWPR